MLASNAPSAGSQPVTGTPVDAPAPGPSTASATGARRRSTAAMRAPAAGPARQTQRPSGLPQAASPGELQDAGTQGHGGGSEDSGGEEGDSASLPDDLQQEPDPFYDETADDKDSAWADRQRGGRVSDAVLSCPGCFTTLCIDCQRHEKYHNQYRAMFVMNCAVEEDEDEQGGSGGQAAGFHPEAGAAAGASGGGRGGRRPKRAKTSSQYRRVCCSVCGTEVGALDVEEELYHFYHVFPSNA